MSEPDEPLPAAEPVEHGPPDSYHPIYDSVKAWLEGEHHVKPDVKPPARRRTRAPVKGRVAKS